VLSRENGQGYHFGLEVEYLLVDSETFHPLWHRDLSFAELNAAFESIPISDLPPLDGLELEPPHRKLMPFVVEGYHLPAPELSPQEVLPKGIEIRTPVCPSIESCLQCLQELQGRMQHALGALGYHAIAASHHPIEDHFEGPQNKRRHDFWQWAMLAMTTYGPDVNVSLPATLGDRLDPADLHRKVNHYAPALTALTLASPIVRGDLWRIRGRVGKSIRTYRRSTIAPAIELHPEEAGRMEYKTFEATSSLAELHGYFLLWLEVLLDEGLRGRASEQTRVYDLGAVACDGLSAETIAERAAEVLERSPATLAGRGFDPTPLVPFRDRLQSGRLPADDLIDIFEAERSIPAVLRHLAAPIPNSAARIAGIVARGERSRSASVHATP
jgi:carboxylate-amine ligase